MATITTKMIPVYVVYVDMYYPGSWGSEECGAFFDLAEAEAAMQALRTRAGFDDAYVCEYELPSTMCVDTAYVTWVIDWDVCTDPVTVSVKLGDDAEADEDSADSADRCYAVAEFVRVVCRVKDQDF